MSELSPLMDVTLIHLKAIRLSLLRLHKALLDSEREVYEQTHGKIQSQGELFQLVLEDEWFKWLRPISQFIVQIDELLASREPITFDQANDLVQRSHSLLKPDAEGTSAQQRYDQAIQRDPNIAFMHAELVMLFAEG